jgi:heme/copper-type cytochrome/quinol oxidase subunit 2
MILALAAVVTAASQAIRLHRLSCRKNGLDAIRRLLSMNHGSRVGEVLPQWRQVFIWQMAVLWLILSAFVMVIGLLILAWTAAATGEMWSGQTWLAITFTIVTVLILSIFGWEQWTLFSWDGVEVSDEDEGRLQI